MIDGIKGINGEGDILYSPWEKGTLFSNISRLQWRGGRGEEDVVQKLQNL